MTDRKESEGEGGLVLPEADASFDVEESEYGLDVDERQSSEIREIFGTAFPQYLQPVEETLQQILADRADVESLETLDGMLTSLETASARMGFDSVETILQRLHGRMNQIRSDPTAEVSRESREDILGDLMDLKDLAEKMGGKVATPDEAQSQTLFSVLKNREGVGDLVLRRLSSAGVITVDQLLMARPDEIAAVAGLDLPLVKKLQALLSPGNTDVPAVAPVDGKAPSGLETLHEQVLQQLRAEVDAEAAIEELKAKIRSQSARIGPLKAELDALEGGQKKDKKTMKTADRDLDNLIGSLHTLLARRDALVRRVAEADEEALGQTTRVETLEREKRGLQKRMTRLGREVGGVLDTLKGQRLE
jgi:chorismate mutase